MSAFPRLKTNAVAQYPSQRVIEFQNQALRFVDGSEQRYRGSAGPLHRWVIRLDGLDEGEAAAFDEFLRTTRGGFGSFEFTDPWDGNVYDDCSLADDDLNISVVDVSSSRTVLTVLENRA